MFRGLLNYKLNYAASIFIIVLISGFYYAASGFAAENSLLVMTGAASKPAMEELAKEYERNTGVKIELNINGSGVLLSQIKLTEKGDIYFPGSVDFIEKAKRENLIIETTETKIVYLVPAINVKKGNPKNIKSLKDLCRPGIKLVIANPEMVCLGVFAAELAEHNFNAEEKAAFRKNIINYVESCEKTANVISLDAADAVIGWSVFDNWDPKRIETIKINPDEVIRISYLSAAVTKYCKNTKLALQFIKYMKSPDGGMKFFEKYGYFTTPQDALKYLGKEKPVGGDEYIVPQEWMFKK